jgi:hypothetical protein
LYGVNAVLSAAYALAFGSTAFLVWHLARRYPSAPHRIALQIGIDGRPTGPTAGKWILWLAPAVLIVVVPLLGMQLVVAPKPADATLGMALVQIVIAEVAWILVWSTDRQIELARDASARIVPAQFLRVVLPLLATIALTLVVAMRS